MIKKLTLCSIILLLWTVTAQAAELGISFSDKTAQLALKQQMTDFNNNRSVFGVRGLYNDSKDTELVSASFKVLGPLANTGLEIGAGVRGYYINSGINSDEIAAGGIGAEVQLVLHASPKISFKGSLYYCPEVFNTLDGKGLWDAEVSATLEIAPQATAFATYTEIEADIENLGERTLDKTLRVGLSLGF